jgi:S-DNA-T family DNA segregation ATPase FtsK/SpoIIIE
VTEAKYVSGETAAEARRVSKQQLRQTVHRMEDALFGDPGRLDRDLWLSRIADLLLDGTTAIGKSAALEAVRDGIRQGVAPIDLRGYSHVFVAGADAAAPFGEQEPIADLRRGLQEVFAREQVRQLVTAYEARSALTPIRSSLGSERPWDLVEFRPPAPRVSWTVRPEGAPAAPATPPPAAPSAASARSAAAPMAASPPGPPVATPAERPDAPPAPEPVSAASPDIASLIQSNTLQRASDTQAEEAWLEGTAQKLGRRSSVMACRRRFVRRSPHREARPEQSPRPAAR